MERPTELDAMLATLDGLLPGPDEIPETADPATGGFGVGQIVRVRPR
jgi:hypothetical protein